MQVLDPAEQQERWQFTIWEDITTMMWHDKATYIYIAGLVYINLAVTDKGDSYLP